MFTHSWVLFVGFAVFWLFFSFCCCLFFVCLGFFVWFGVFFCLFGGLVFVGVFNLDDKIGSHHMQNEPNA